MDLQHGDHCVKPDAALSVAGGCVRINGMYHPGSAPRALRERHRLTVTGLLAALANRIST